MSIKPIALAGAALIALTAGVNVAYADDQDDEVWQLNTEQLEKARSGDTAPTTAPAPAAEEKDGQGGPEFQGPPSPDEGMSDDEDTTDEPAAEEEDVPQGPEDEAPAEPK